MTLRSMSSIRRTRPDSLPSPSATKKSVALAIFKETSAFKLYIEMALLIKNEKARAILTTLAEEELEHRTRLEQLLGRTKMANTLSNWIAINREAG